MILMIMVIMIVVSIDPNIMIITIGNVMSMVVIEKIITIMIVVPKIIL